MNYVNILLGRIIKISLGFWYMSKEQTPPESRMWEKDFPVVVVPVGDVVK